MLYLTTGLPGNGKTLYTLSIVEERRKKEGREVYYFNIPELTLPWTKLESGDEWIKVPDGSIVVIDECQTTFPGLALGKVLPPHYADIATHRHRGLDIYLITQDSMQFEAKVRRLVQTHYHVHRAAGLKGATIWRWENGVGNPGDYHSRQAAAKSMWRHPKDFYQVYRSATLHTHKVKLPLKLLWFPVLFAVIGFSAYRLYGFFGKSQAEETAKSSSIVGKVASGAPAGTVQGGSISPAGTAKVKTVAEYVAERQPRIEGLPHTAPVYDKLTEPVRAPVIAGCVTMKDRCECYTEQGTRLNTTRSICLSYASSGVFQEFDSRPRQQYGQPLPTVPLQAKTEYQVLIPESTGMERSSQ